MKTWTKKFSNALVFIVLIGIFPCNGVSWLQQLEHIVKTRKENKGEESNFTPSRRTFYSYDPQEVFKILGVPEYPSHLPEAEPIQPGHTLIRPSLGMLKSSVKFPHRDLEDGSGVYGNIENLGLSYGGTNERVKYTGFRRMPADYVMVIPEKNNMQQSKPRYKLVSTVLDLEKENTIKNVLSLLQKLKFAGKINIFILSLLDKASAYKSTLETTKSYYLSDDRENERRDKSMMYRYRPVIPIRDYSQLRTKKPERSPEPLRTFKPREMLKLDNELDTFHFEDEHEKFEDNSKAIEKISESAKLKLNSFLNTKDSFNHIRFSEDALNYNDLIPRNLINEKIRSWWFYNQDDFTPFTIS